MELVYHWLAHMIKVEDVSTWSLEAISHRTHFKGVLTLVYMFMKTIFYLKVPFSWTDPLSHFMVDQALLKGAQNNTREGGHWFNKV